MTSVVENVLVAVATIGLQERAWPQKPPGPSEWPEILRGLDTHRLTGLAALAVESGRLVLDDGQLAELAISDVRSAKSTVAAEAAMLDLADRLDGERVPFRVLKGSAAAQLDWSIPDRRRHIDTDLLVRGDDLAGVVAIAKRVGASRRVPELRPGFDQRFAKSVTMDSSRGGIDLHRSLVVGPHCFLVNIDDLWAEPRAFGVCSRDLLGVAAPAAHVHYAMHATFTGAQRLGNLRDFVECACHADLDAAAALARRWRATAVVKQACEHVRDRLRFSRDHELVRWGASLAPTDDEYRLAASYGQASRNAAALARASLRYVPGLPDKLRFAYAVAWPSKANRATRRRSPSDQASRLRQHLRRWRA